MSYSPEEQKHISQFSQMINELIYTLNELGEDTESSKTIKQVKLDTHNLISLSGCRRGTTNLTRIRSIYV